MPSSKTMPGLERKPGGPDNWVEKAGGLPSYIERIAKHLHHEQGMSISRAIASAVNTVKRWCAGGSVTKTGASKSNVSADTKAKACRAVEQWEAKKAKSKVDASQEKERLVNIEGELVGESDAREVYLAVARMDLEARRVGDVLKGVTIDRDTYGIALHQARQERRLDLSIGGGGPIHFDPQKHPRGLKGRFREVVKGLKVGEAVELPDGTKVKSLDNGYKVGDSKIGSAREAADTALTRSAQSDHEKSVGGKKQYKSISEVPGAAMQPDDPLGDMGGPSTKKPTDKTDIGGGESSDTQADLESGIKEVLPGANTRTGRKGGIAVGGFSMRPEEAQQKLRDAGFEVEDDFGQTVVKGKREQGEADEFEVVKGKNGKGGKPGQWTLWPLVGDMEIEMPDGGPTATITEAEFDPDKPWHANVFPDAEATDYEEQDFETADQAREWVESKLKAPDTIEAGDGGDTEADAYNKPMPGSPETASRAPAGGDEDYTAAAEEMVSYLQESDSYIETDEDEENWLESLGHLDTSDFEGEFAGPDDYDSANLPKGTQEVFIFPDGTLIAAKGPGDYEIVKPGEVPTDDELKRASGKVVDVHDDATISFEDFQEGKRNVSIEHPFGEGTIAMTEDEEGQLAHALTDFDFESDDPYTVDIHDDATVTITKGQPIGSKTTDEEEPTLDVMFEHPFMPDGAVAVNLDPEEVDTFVRSLRGGPARSQSGKAGGRKKSEEGGGPVSQVDTRGLTEEAPGEIRAVVEENRLRRESGAEPLSGQEKEDFLRDYRASVAPEAAEAEEPDWGPYGDRDTAVEELVNWFQAEIDAIAETKGFDRENPDHSGKVEEQVSEEIASYLPSAGEIAAQQLGTPSGEPLDGWEATERGVKLPDGTEVYIDPDTWDVKIKEPGEQ